MKKQLILLLIFVLLVASVYVYFSIPQSKEKYFVQDGLVSYSNRPPVIYQKLARVIDDENRTTNKIYFESHRVKIYGLLSVPKTGPEKKPAFVFIPGAQVTKESGNDGVVKDLNELGFITLTLDTRGTGETLDKVNSFDEDLLLFSNSQEPFQHKLIYDTVRAFDLLKSFPEVDSSKIYAGGESMGGRLAIITAAIEPKIKGALVISSAGYKFPIQEKANVNEFLSSFDPDSYIELISPRLLIMIHGTNDTVIPLDYAKDTFLKAGEPKKFFEVSDGHGYNREEGKEILKRELESWE